MKERVKERVVGNHRTTIIGLIILALSVFVLIKGYATWDQVVGFMTLSGVLAWVKDTIFKA